MVRILLPVVSLAGVVSMAVAGVDDTVIDGISTLGSVPHGWLIIIVMACVIPSFIFAAWVIKNKGDTVSQAEFVRALGNNAKDHERIGNGQERLHDDIDSIRKELAEVRSDLKLLVNSTNKRSGDGVSDSIMEAIRQGLKEIKDDKQ